MKWFITLIILTSVLGVNIMGCSAFGTRPNQTEKLKFEQSKQFNVESKEFENRRQNIIKEMKKNMKFFSLLKEWLTPKKDQIPEKKLPEVKPNFEEFYQDTNDLKAIWLGHSTILLNINNKRVLIDPVFSNSAAPVSFMAKRFQPPVVALEELPKIDYILISHDHYDHLDMETINFFKDKDLKFITPLGVGSHLRGWGVDSTKIIEKDWWESFTENDLEFIATPAQHFSGRDGIHDNETLWASWVLKSKEHKVYFSGDSGYDTHFKTIGDKYGPFDVAFIENGQYNLKWHAVHMLPDEGAKAYDDLKAKKYFPIHWGMFKLSLHTWFEPIDKIYELSKTNNINLITTRIGKIVNLSKESELDLWWREKL